MKKLIQISIVFVIALVGSTEACCAGWSFSAYETRGYDYFYPAFRVVVKLPDGNIIGWNKDTGHWSGTIKESKVNTGTFQYPVNSNECTSTEPEEVRNIDIPGVGGEYTVLSAIYCKNMFSGVNSFIGSGYAVLIGVPSDPKYSDAQYEVILYPEKQTVIEMCFSYYIEGEEQSNELCTDTAYTKNIILSPGIEQKIEFDYNYKSEEATVLSKVVTPSNLSGSWETCRTLGMIKNHGLYTSVQKKLEHAKSKYDSGAVETANNVYAALVNELEAQYGKGIDAECADILMGDLKSGVK